jgi:hypothetical protein
MLLSLTSNILSASSSELQTILSLPLYYINRIVVQKFGHRDIYEILQRINIHNNTPNSGVPEFYEVFQFSAYWYTRSTTGTSTSTSTGSTVRVVQVLVLRVGWRCPVPLSGF